jgi:MFS family permease
VVAARVGSAAPFQAYAGVLPFLQGEWRMSGSDAGALAFSWQLAFAASLVILSPLADRVGPRRVFVASSWATTAAVALIPLLADGYVAGLLLFSLLALVSGGTYTPGLVLLARRVAPQRRGHAIGWFLAAASLGYALALLIIGFLAPAVGWRGALFVLAGLSAVSATVASVALPPDPPLGTARPALGSMARGVILNRPALLITAGYTFHAWELLGMWTWTPAFLGAILAMHGEGEAAIGTGVALVASFHLVGLVANAVAGRLSDRWGRTAVILAMLGISAVCSFSFGWLFTAPLIVVLVVGLVYAFAAIADSPVLSTGFTELIEPPVLGAWFAIRSLAGFGAGAAAAWLFGVILDLSNAERHIGEYSVWGWAFSALGAGALVAFGAIALLRRLPEAGLMADGRR